ncbi:MAG: hypothetical protein KDD48_06350 [Bdellovibrionales bacterium]|nr:hypothetical protein [Bdellovibrionales bacterium]
MKTITEFTRLEIKEAFNLRHILLQEKKTTPPKPTSSTESNSDKPSESKIVENSNASTESEAPQHADIMKDPPQDQALEQSMDTLTSDETSHAPVETPPEETTDTPKKGHEPPASSSKEVIIKSPEELLVQRQEERRLEWAAKISEIKDAFSTRIKDKFKWSEQKTELALAALDVVFRKRLEDLRSLRIMKLEKENEPLPKYGKKIGDHVFVAEYYPPKPGEKSFKKDRSRKKRGKKRSFNKNRKPSSGADRSKRDSLPSKNKV